jgi:hypothetical protein
MIQADVATTLDRSQLKARFQEASVLNAQAYYQVAPWTYIALMKLHNLEHGKGSRRGTLNVPVSADAAMFARAVLSDLKEEELPIPGICSVEGGSVALIWTLGLRQLEAIFGPDKSGSFVLSDGDRIIGDGEFYSTDTAPLSTALEGMMEG